MDELTADLYSYSDVDRYKERVLNTIEKLEPLSAEYGDYIYRESVIRIIKDGV